MKERAVLATALVWLSVACGTSAAQTTAASDLSRARLEGAYDVAYELVRLANAAPNGFEHYFGPLGESTVQVWEMIPTCATGPCDTLSPLGWYPSDGGTYYPSDLFKPAGGIYIETFGDHGWNCDPAPGGDAFNETITIQLTPTRAQLIGGEFVVTDFRADRSAKFTPTAVAAAAGCTPFEADWKLVGSRYAWR
jgi:hypothetical protein